MCVTDNDCSEDENDYICVDVSTQHKCRAILKYIGSQLQQVCIPETSPHECKTDSDCGNLKCSEDVSTEWTKCWELNRYNKF